MGNLQSRTQPYDTFSQRILLDTLKMNIFAPKEVYWQVNAELVTVLGQNDFSRKQIFPT